MYKSVQGVGERDPFFPFPSEHAAERQYLQSAAWKMEILTNWDAVQSGVVKLKIVFIFSFN